MYEMYIIKNNKKVSERVNIMAVNCDLLSNLTNVVYNVIFARYLLDPQEVKARIEAVKRQTAAQ